MTSASEFVPAIYPVNDYGPLMKGIVIGGLGIFHVFLAQFAIGGGFLMWWLEWLGQSGKQPAARKVVDSVFRVLILLSFVTGALTGRYAAIRAINSRSSRSSRATGVHVERSRAMVGSAGAVTSRA